MGALEAYWAGTCPEAGRDAVIARNKADDLQWARELSQRLKYLLIAGRTPKRTFPIQDLERDRIRDALASGAPFVQIPSGRDRLGLGSPPGYDCSEDLGSGSPGRPRRA